jgi:hypothetical protein
LATLSDTTPSAVLLVCKVDRALAAIPLRLMACSFSRWLYCREQIPQASCHDTVQAKAAEKSLSPRFRGIIKRQSLPVWAVHALRKLCGGRATLP